MMHRYSRTFTLVASTLTMLLCSACSSLDMPQQSAATQVAALSPRIYQKSIQLSGKISVRYEKNGKPEQLPGSFEWDQNGSNLHITLLSPLGQTVARITQDEQRAILEQDGQAPRYAQNLNQLLQDHLGWALPVAGMRDWLQGFTLQADGTRQALSRIDQQLDSDGWTLRYVSWQQDVDLPKRIELSRYTTEVGNVSISIFIQAPNT
ncbi:lipoprotein insertase outer membrane protein LolB [Undibacterium sp. RuRC25W]|uniref:lipoprotein insertase outer membrane protein LolB n=1 Tax=Undibacterium sp. RuRC25W TaxID=3413047 RepID=UPI003BF3A98F